MSFGRERSHFRLWHAVAVLFRSGTGPGRFLVLHHGSTGQAAWLSGLRHRPKTDVVRSIVGKTLSGEAAHWRSAPAAIFLLMIELAIRGIEGTVPVTSRRAYRILSAGARFMVCPAITRPTSESCRQCNSRFPLSVDQTRAREIRRLQSCRVVAVNSTTGASRLRRWNLR